jgi:phosphoribosylaminoimidazolecarboxamide formyltransferase / IMP cyclohydrolase
LWDFNLRREGELIMAFKINMALISVTDKTSLVPFGALLKEHDVEIISTGGTAKRLSKGGIAVRQVSDMTGFPEILNGRVKTLNPKVFGGLLALRNSSDQMAQLEENGIEVIDLVNVNLYNFEQLFSKTADQLTLLEVLELIDIGGTSLLRAAAKNFAHVVVITSPSQYVDFKRRLREDKIDWRYRRQLAGDVWKLTAKYDTMIDEFWESEVFDELCGRNFGS